MITLALPLRYQIDYSIWATSRLLNVATTLSSEQLQRDFGTADKSIVGTLLHVYRSERIWFDRIQSRDPSLAVEEWLIAVEGWPGLHQQWRDWAATVTDESASAPLEYKNNKGYPQQNALWAVILHVVNHSTHHRGQVSGFLRALGKTPPPLDSIAYARELGI